MNLLCLNSFFLHISLCPLFIPHLTSFNTFDKKNFKKKKKKATNCVLSRTHIRKKKKKKDEFGKIKKVSNASHSVRLCRSCNRLVVGSPPSFHGRVVIFFFFFFFFFPEAKPLKKPNPKGECGHNRNLKKKKKKKTTIFLNCFFFFCLHNYP